jgi:hypothetical protein
MFSVFLRVNVYLAMWLRTYVFFFFPNLKRIALVVTRDLRITGEVDDIYIGDLNTYFDLVKFTKA